MGSKEAFIETRFRETYFEREHGMFAAIDSCLTKEYITAALILIYSTIDSLAFLNMPPEQANVQRRDYKEWVKQYLDLQELGISESDLYAARCGVVHTFSAESSMSKKKEAQEVYYAWGNYQPIAPLPKKGAIMIHINKLINTLELGTAVFLGDILRDPQKSDVAWCRLWKSFGPLKIR